MTLLGSMLVMHHKYKTTKAGDNTGEVSSLWFCYYQGYPPVQLSTSFELSYLVEN